MAGKHKDPLEIATRCFNSCGCDFCVLVRKNLGSAPPEDAARAFAAAVSKAVGETVAERQHTRALVRSAVAEAIREVAAEAAKEKH